MASGSPTAAAPVPGAPVRWGVLGTGGIAARFLADLSVLGAREARAVAVGSRRPGGAAALADRFGVGVRCDSYEELCAHPEVDAVYVATPHPFHLPNALTAIAAGKHVLVEKPFTTSGAEARALAAAARAAGVFCMEAMWTRFLPHMRQLRRLLDDGALGEVRLLAADLGQAFSPDPAHRLFAPELGGGATLDLGVYPVALASMVLGAPSEVLVASTPAMTGVDGTTAVLLRHPGGALANLTFTMSARTPVHAWVAGDRGRVELGRPWYSAADLTYTPLTGTPQHWPADAHEEGPVVRPGVDELPAKGMWLMQREVGRCIRAGLTESPLMPLAETVQIADTLDAVLRTADRPGARTGD